MEGGREEEGREGKSVMVGDERTPRVSNVNGPMLTMHE